MNEGLFVVALASPGEPRFLSESGVWATVATAGRFSTEQTARNAQRPDDRPYRVTGFGG